MLNDMIAFSLSKCWNLNIRPVEKGMIFLILATILAITTTRAYASTRAPVRSVDPVTSRRFGLNDSFVIILSSSNAGKL